MSDKLMRVMGFWALTAYGVGDILGAGIYGLIGRAAGQMGNAVWLAFVTSMLAAVLTGLSYASLGSSYPKTAGAAHVISRAFGKPFLSYLVGLGVLASGMTSMATSARVFSGYMMAFVEGIPLELIAVLFIATLTLINFRGMKESTWFNVVCTLIEFSGLVIVALVGLRYLGSVNYLQVPTSVDPLSTSNGLSISLCLQGAVLVFYSFIGFEDMLNVTEEVKEPEKIFHKALITAVLVSTGIYILTSLVAVSVVPHEILATSKQPLVDVVRTAAPWFPSGLFSIISLFAVSNTALINFIMGSRLIYGMAEQGLLPRALSAIHHTRKTPHRAILVFAGIVILLMFAGDVSALAKSTSVLLLLSFVLMNLALITLKKRPGEMQGRFHVPDWVPVGGIIVSLAMLFHVKQREIVIAGGLLLFISGLYFFQRQSARRKPI